MLIAKSSAPAGRDARLGATIPGLRLREIYFQTFLMLVTSGAGVGSSVFTVYDLGQPWSDGYIESFNGRVRDEYLNLTQFWSLTQTRVVITDWKPEYNHLRRHSALGYEQG